MPRLGRFRWPRITTVMANLSPVQRSLSGRTRKKRELHPENEFCHGSWRADIYYAHDKRLWMTLSAALAWVGRLHERGGVIPAYYLPTTVPGATIEERLTCVWEERGVTRMVEIEDELSVETGLVEWGWTI